ncbi:hypothetical protein [Mycolicibacterium sp.]|uniref:hypothetical protein n=1 Tax=Mycolicibacterium sp. TaxID=2320850 RepID=UPI001A186A14|nr:hypothetical protein [Mycolicibacterium sp.]MBJ7341851.1 hypothetical protein [Mycolicibacterium sp.]
MKWLLIAVAVLLVIGISVGATLIFTRDGSGGGTTTPTSGGASDIASANDTGPVSIITEEPTCEKFVGVNNSLADVQDQGWGDLRSTLGAASTWTSDQRTQFEAVAKATRNAADQVVPLAKQTPHRLMRELFEQFTWYGRAYADSIPNYVPSDNELASATVNASSALVGICNAIAYGSAGRSIAVDPAAPPSSTSVLGDPARPAPFISAPGQTCNSWEQISTKFDTDTAEWQQRDTSIAATQWTPEQRSIESAARPVLSAFATEMERIGRQSLSAAFEDFATAAALYLRAAVAAGDNYVTSDSWLSFVSFRLNLLIVNACNVSGR